MDLGVLATAVLGGGVSGAIIGSLVSLLIQRRQHTQEDRHRFATVKRERYADLLHETAEVVQELSHQRDVARSIAAGSKEDLPALRTSDRVRWLTEEIAILSPAAGAKANELLSVIVALHASFAVDARKPERPIGSATQFGEARMEFEKIRREFIAAATNDLGTAVS